MRKAALQAQIIDNMNGQNLLLSQKEPRFNAEEMPRPALKKRWAREMLLWCWIAEVE